MGCSIEKEHPMAKKKTSYGDIWIKAYLAALTRLPAEEAYHEANASIGYVRRFMNCASDNPIFVKIQNHADVDIRDIYKACIFDAKKGEYSDKFFPEYIESKTTHQELPPKPKSE